MSWQISRITMRESQATIMKTNVVLIGFMGVGKSVTGKLLAQKLGYRFVDTDKVIEQKYKRKIKDIFAQEGEAAFRAMESEVIRELSGRTSLVISTGGGVAAKKDDMEFLRSTGIVISLMALPETIYKRTNNSKRPLLAAKSPEERLTVIRELLAQRMKYYQQADFILATDFTNPLQNADEIQRYIKKRSKRSNKK